MEEQMHTTIDQQETSAVNEIQPTPKPKKSKTALLIALGLASSSAFGFAGGYLANLQQYANQPAVLYQTASPNITNTGTADTSITDIVSLTTNSVVEITTESMTTGFFMQQAISKGAGSGVIITADGYIVTNDHVVENASTIKVRLKDGTEYDAALIGTDAKTDIALLKIAANNLQPAIFGDSGSLAVGESVIAVGNPLGQLGGTVTNGIISALDREITIENETMRLLQTNAAINPGNSGGGLFNMRGELIGIVNAKSSGSDIEGLGFAIPSSDAKKVVADLLEHGYVRGRVQLGVSLLDVTTEQAALMYRVNELGLYIQEVTPNSSAAEAGLKAGDRIMSFAGKEVNSYSDLKGLLNQSEVGQTAAMKIKRDGKEVTVNITLKEYNPLSSATNKG